MPDEQYNSSVTGEAIQTKTAFWLVFLPRILLGRNWCPRLCLFVQSSPLWRTCRRRVWFFYLLSFQYWHHNQQPAQYFSQRSAPGGSTTATGPIETSSTGIC